MCANSSVGKQNKQMQGKEGKWSKILTKDQSNHYEIVSEIMMSSRLTKAQLQLLQRGSSWLVWKKVYVYNAIALETEWVLQQDA